MGVTWGLQAPYPASFLTDIIKAQKLSEKVRQTAENILKNRTLTEFQIDAYLGPVEMDWKPSVKISFPTRLEYVNDMQKVSYLERGRLGITAAICCSIQHALHSICGLLVKPRQKIDLFALLQNPRRATVYGQTPPCLYAAIRNELILPAFGSLKQFYETFMKYRSESYGYSGALRRFSVCSRGYSEKIARSFFSPDEPMQKLITLFLQLSCANGRLPTGPPFKPLNGQNPFKWRKTDPLKQEFRKRDPEFYQKSRS